MKIMSTRVLMGLFITNLVAMSAHAMQVDAYGFLKTSYVTSDNALNSFSSPTAQAPTEVANLDAQTKVNDRSTSASPPTSLSSDAGFQRRTLSNFQVAQSRFGFNLVKSERLSGKLEFDFIDFARDQATGVNTPRLRIAEIYYKWSDTLSIRAGQGWSTFSNGISHTTNFVGNNFRSGNSGFLSQQIELKKIFGQFSLFGALAEKGRVTGAAQDETHLGSPMMILKGEYNDDTNKIGLAFVHADIDNTAAQLDLPNSEAKGFKVFYVAKMSALEFKTEYYNGTNLNDLFFLTLASRSVSSSSNNLNKGELAEHGYYASLKYNLDQLQTVWFGYGTAKIDSSLSKIKDTSLVENETVRVGYQFHLGDGLSLFGEATNFKSKYLANNLTNGSQDVSTFYTTGLDAGLILNF